MTAFAPFSCDMAGLPGVDDVASLLRRHFAPSEGNENIALTQATGRILARAPQALCAMPPCDRSAMDGYAFRFGDTGPLQCIGRAPAGKPFTGIVGKEQCVGIGTGGALPRGCDSVAIREDCQVTAAGILAAATAKGANVRRRGEDFCIGDILLQAGTRLSPRQIGLLAAAGIAGVTVRQPLRVALFSIGDELNNAAPDSIADANRPMLHALCAAQGMTVTDLGILPDCRDAVAAALARAAPHHDAILCSASSCEGDDDHARGALMQAGGTLLIAGAAIRPGKPVSFGAIGGKPYIALPGNPAAAYITFLILGLPLLRYLCGATACEPAWQMVPSSFNHRKKSGIREYVRIRIQAGPDGSLCAGNAADNGPAMLRSLAAVDGLACFGEACVDIRAGDKIAVATFSALEAP